jgi:hypothetical protein
MKPLGIKIEIFINVDTFGENISRSTSSLQDSTNDIIESINAKFQELINYFDFIKSYGTKY